MTDLSREQQVVLACARYPMDIASVTLDGVDWERIFETARALGVLTLVGWNLNAHFREKVPVPVRETLQRLRHTAMTMSARMAARTAEVMRWFEAEGIEVLLLKGVVLSSLLYESPLLRLSSDIDVMVHPCDVPHAWQMLKRRGVRPSYDFDEQQLDALIRCGHAHDFCAFERELMIDLHWGFLRWLCPLDVERVWRRAIKVCVDQRVYRTLSREDHLLLLCAHPVKHRYADMRGICDIAGILRVGSDLDWDYIRNQARAHGHEQILWTGIRLAEELLGAPVSKAIQQEMDTMASVMKRVREIKKRLLKQKNNWLTDSATVWGWRMQDGWWRKTSYLFSKMFVPNEEDFVWVSLPRPFFFAYYGIRFIRLPWRYMGIIQRLRCQRTGLRIHESGGSISPQRSANNSHQKRHL